MNPETCKIKVSKLSPMKIYTSRSELENVLCGIVEESCTDTAEKLSEIYTGTYLSVDEILSCVREHSPKDRVNEIKRKFLTLVKNINDREIIKGGFLALCSDEDSIAELRKILLSGYDFSDYIKDGFILFNFETINYYKLLSECEKDKKDRSQGTLLMVKYNPERVSMGWIRAFYNAKDFKFKELV